MSGAILGEKRSYVDTITEPTIRHTLAHAPSSASRRPQHRYYDGYALNNLSALSLGRNGEGDRQNQQQPLKRFRFATSKDQASHDHRNHLHFSHKHPRLSSMGDASSSEEDEEEEEEESERESMVHGSLRIDEPNRSDNLGGACSSSSSTESSKAIAAQDNLEQKASAATATAAAVATSTSLEEDVQLTDDQERQLMQLLPRKKRLMVSKKGSSDSDPIFSLKDVRYIVREALLKAERVNNEKTMEIVQEKLAEQWNVFSRYHDDYVRRECKNNELSYLS